MVTIAFDASTTCTGWSVFKDGGYVNSGTINLKKIRDTELRVYEMQKEIIRVIKEYAPDKIFLEDTVSEKGVGTLKILCWLAGGIKFYAKYKGYDLELVLPSAWRKWLHIQEYKAKRQELKQKAIQFCNDALGIAADEDRAEAICINYAMAIRDEIIDF